MKTIASITPHIRTAHRYRFDGRPEESRRLGLCYAFHLCEEGSGSIIIDGKTHTLRKGTLVFLPPGMINGFVSDPETPLALYNLYCDLWSETPIQAPHLSFYPEEADPSFMTPAVADVTLLNKPLVITLSVGSPLHSGFVHICGVFSDISMKERAAAAEAMLYGWILHWAHEREKQSFGDPRMAFLLDQIHSESPEEPDYEYLLRASKLQKSQLHKLFKDMTGYSPKQYLLRLKLEKARVMLTESNRSIESVAESLGYSSVHFFSRQFSRLYGIPPGFYRRNAALYENGL